jgi:TPR repeat protein
MMNVFAQLKVGKGVVKNVNEAYRYYSLAAEQGNCNAQFNLGMFVVPLFLFLF